MSKENIFRPRARLMLQLGDQLIKNESIAILELVKNSYDAEATQVEIQMSKLHDPKEGVISVKDNGCGMDYNIIRDVWLEPGSDYKALLLKEIESSEKKFKRRPLGEKGIGRFGAHKLGNIVELISRMHDKKEVCVKIDWDVFNKTKYIDEVPINIIERIPEVFKGNQSGTLIKISHLRPEQWSKNTLNELFRSVNAICSPFNAPDSFNITIKIDDPNISEEVPTIDEIKKAALYRFYCELKGNEITVFSYKFRPYASMTKLSKRTLTYNIPKKENTFLDFNKIKQMVGKSVRNPETDTKNSPPINLSANGMKIGKVRFEGFIFDRQSKVLKYSPLDSKTIKTYLDQNGGVRVYRDGVRVYDYGELENDWLGLEKSRLYDPGVKINRGLILATVHLDRESSTSLIEKTNREGFIDNDAYKTLRKAIIYTIGLIEACRNKDKEKVRLYYGLSPKSEPVLATIDELKEIVESRVKDKKVQEECIWYLKKIKTEYQEINEVLLTSANAGLNLSVAIHEIEKIISELSETARKEKSSAKVVKMIEHLSELIEMYGTIIRKSKNKVEDLKILIEDALFHVQYRLEAHKIEVIKEYSSFKENVGIECSSRLIIGSILNLIDNSIYWLERFKIKGKKIIISLKNKSPNYIQLLVADNGEGFALPPEQMIKPFVSLKPGGMGLGLHIASEVLLAQGGTVEFPKFSELNLPEEFQKGAIVSLTFKKDN
jgi:signal transduction histidine kinase